MMYKEKAIERLNKIDWNNVGKNCKKEDKYLFYESLRRMAVICSEKRIKVFLPFAINIADVVHEGTHALDFKNKYGKEGVSMWSWEKRAFFYERQYQLTTGSKPEYATINDMLVNIWGNYDNKIYMPY